MHRTAIENPDRKNETLPRVAILGTGSMGGAMAARLLEAGFPVHIWNRTSDPMAGLIARGATAHPTAAQAVRSVQVVLTMLPDESALREVILAADPMDALQAGTVWAQMGTIGVEATERIAREMARWRPDVAFVDAPVSGSRAPARSGALTVFASGPEEAKARLEPVFDTLGERTLWLGPAGAGSRMKLVVNSLLAFEIEAIAEVHALAAALGVPYARLAEALNGSPLASPFEIGKLTKIESGDDSADFSLEWALKDLDLALGSAGPGPAPVTAAIAQRWRELVVRGYGRLDVSAAHIGLEARTPAVVKP
jgi:3-hydroxyisobutyrate dehydrogenase